WSSSPGTPQGYSTIASPPLTLQLAPPPANAGTLGLLTINSGPAITGMGVPLGIPNDWGWAIKWGALADLLLAPGPAYDPQRAQYCESRFQGALQIAQLMPQIIQAQLSSLPLPVMALFDLDQTLPSWQSATGPSLVLGVSQNLFVLAPFTANQGLTLDLVRTALLPVLDGDFLQIGPEELDAILGYAIHLASFKLAGGEFTATQPLLDAFNQAAVRYNRILAAESTYLAIMKGESTREASVRPYIAKE
ncbi:MAG: hypothetical protein ACRD22_08210, partial [Terriglobia bacterium]